VPLARARTVTGTDGKTRTYNPPQTTTFVDEFRWACRAAGHRGGPLAGELAIHVELWRHHTGNNRGDLDNHVKAILDAGNGFLWADDVQIIEIHARFVATGPTVTGRIRLELVEFAPVEPTQPVEVAAG
jgi:Holliday junction resolvase RusA-like endonuclease